MYACKNTRVNSTVPRLHRSQPCASVETYQEQGMPNYSKHNHQHRHPIFKVHTQPAHSNGASTQHQHRHPVFTKCTASSEPPAWLHVLKKRYCACISRVIGTLKGCLTYTVLVTRQSCRNLHNSASLNVERVMAAPLGLSWVNGQNADL